MLIKFKYSKYGMKTTTRKIQLTGRKVNVISALRKGEVFTISSRFFTTRLSRSAKKQGKRTLCVPCIDFFMCSWGEVNIFETHTFNALLPFSCDVAATPLCATLLKHVQKWYFVIFIVLTDCGIGNS